ncbi:LOW QUALITY PROTEIN: cAMP-dependent protein kinase type II regulatory subunit-like [Pollicipes pollicipes]|uniref:LOW QUALITY PROTEIN: cAMP-dependent protein kinase type II regulatory subunit-like n=1 Tax=Pollicipes pollicipes TaxID=41117 RepID=UPI0018854017|nr:LOW QUALITY PROTEIN: cAMP-dependent protein kinase type II regulatory subunit-like [Pollicipes pollicipes]
MNGKQVDSTAIYVKTDDSDEPKKVGSYENQGSFCELALMYNMPRADSEGSLWAMDRQTFRRIVLKNAFKKRKMYEQLLESVPMLKTLESYERMNLADALVPRTYKDGELIIEQGDTADGMYFVEEGTVRIMRGEQGQDEVQINAIEKGGYLGELALITKNPRAASAYAVGDVRLAFLDREAFERLLGPCMDVMKREMENYEEELQKIFGSSVNISDVR